MQSKHDADDIEEEFYGHANGYIVDGMFYGTRYEAEQYGPPGAAARAKRVRDPVQYVPSIVAPAKLDMGPRPPKLSDHELRQRSRARRSVRDAVQKGALPRQATQSCVDCGACGPRARIQYDHHMGYDDDCFLAVEPVCTKCHTRRTAAETAVRRANTDAGR